MPGYARRRMACVRRSRIGVGSRADRVMDTAAEGSGLPTCGCFDTRNGQVQAKIGPGCQSVQRGCKGSWEHVGNTVATGTKRGAAWSVTGVKFSVALPNTGGLAYQSQWLRRASYNMTQLAMRRGRSFNGAYGEGGFRQIVR